MCAKTAEPRKWTNLFDLILNGQLDPTQARTAGIFRQSLVHVAIQNGLHLLRVSAQVQDPNHKVLALHRQLPVVVLYRHNRETTESESQSLKTGNHSNTNMVFMPQPQVEGHVNVQCVFLSALLSVVSD